MTDLLVKIRGDASAFRAAARAAFGSAAPGVEEIMTLPGDPGAVGLAGTDATWMRLSGAAGQDRPWDGAHALLDESSPFAARGLNVEAVEPDLVQHWPHYGSGADAAPFAAAACTFDDQDTRGGKAAGPGPAWNLGGGYGQFQQARAQVSAARQKQIMVAHLDTGLDPAHGSLPQNTRLDLQRNFVAGEPPGDARDRAPDGGLSNRGHGTGTLSLLAGNKVAPGTPGFAGFTDFLGAAPQVSVIPVRIADWVVRFSLGTMVQGIDYARQQGAQVLSMSMGGVASQALTDAVNRAYDAGMVLVTAAGNNISGVPSPRSIVFPARYRRVIAACGVMADGRSYSGLATGQMQGNFGPADKMETALGAFTPNVPWAQIGCGTVIDMDGAGTSAATPQVAAAAALWLARHWATVRTYPDPWMRVEAVRRALFLTARKTTAAMAVSEAFQKIGQGVVQAEAALAVVPAPQSSLRRLPPATSSWPWLNLVLGGGVTLAGEGRREAMLALELTQMAQQVAEVDAAIPAPESQASAAAINRYLEAALDAGHPSRSLRAALEAHLGRKAARTPARSKIIAPPQRRRVDPAPPHRRLRIYALDPSIAKSLDTLDLNEATVATDWDDLPTAADPLRPGPVGEYLEVVDVDPVSGKAYDPVDLNDPMLLAQGGLPPSEGNPKFHQQMVYAVGMKTIAHFEEALGRKALWAARPDPADPQKGTEVRRLRIYPHALRAANAYYSPSKAALLFGYFPGAASESGGGVPGGMVFTCLSSDIIAHEMTHALLDGLHRRLQEPSNPDVRAFHEGFADIVALFQHFTYPELVRFEIGRARGDLSAAGLLSGLAPQFGRGTGIGAALRAYSGPNTRTRSYRATAEAHDRGEILVLAVYDAFLAIVGRRTADLIRVATGGTGRLPEGALHPDLVNRLTDETCKTASHILRICIRALDYCPSVDITFGEYLRALITADFELIPDDALGYRIAFMQAFERHGIPVRDVRTMSEESLLWGAPAEDQPEWLTAIFDRVELPLGRRMTRSQIFELSEANRRRVQGVLAAAFRADRTLCRTFGLNPGERRYDEDGTPRGGATSTAFEVTGVRPARRLSSDGDLRVDIIATITQRRPEPVDGKNLANGWFWFRSGSTLVLDGNSGEPRIRYNIVKTAWSERRLELQRHTQAGEFDAPLRALYFGADPAEPFAVLHAGHRGQVNG